MTKQVPWFVWLIPIAVLLVATAKLPYGYYTFTRLVVCATGSFFAYAAWNDNRIAWTILLAGVALLFNPIIPVHLTRNIWFYLDIICAGIFAGHLAFVRLQRGDTQRNVR